MFLINRIMVALLAVVPNCAASFLPEIDAHDSSHNISDRYMVTLRPGADVAKHMALVTALRSRSNDQGRLFGGTSERYNFSGILAYAGHFERSVIENLRGCEDVEAIEADQVAKAESLVTQKDAEVSLDLISHRSSRHTREYIYDESAGSGTYAYVLDSGIYPNRHEFGGRATFGHNCFRDKDNEDHTGHGTHIAGIIGGKRYGVAKMCNLIAVIVLHRGETSNISLLNGLIWAATDILNKGRQQSAVINFSVSGGYSTLMNKIANRAFEQGITIVAAAGNQNTKAATRSPGSADGVITVAATDNDRSRAYFFNYGTCVTMFAPGVNIHSISPGEYLVAMRTGTSQAAAHVAGLVLYSKRLHRLSNARDTMTHVMRLATRGVVRANKASGNLFAYNGSGR